jgi:hypothetical protein
MSRSGLLRRTSAVLLSAGLVVLAVPSVPATPTAASSPVDECPPGWAPTSTKTASQRAAERDLGDERFADLIEQVDARTAGSTVCAPARSPEPAVELMALQAQWSAKTGQVPAGALQAAIAHRAALAQSPAQVPGAAGSARPLGTTPLISDDPRFPSVNGLGLADLAGRVDDFAYDPVARRVFAAVGTGGVWMSSDQGGTWRSVSDAMPYLVVGSVGWTPAGGGTIVAASGEATAGGNNHNGLGAYWSNDLGRTWHLSRGVPEGAMGFAVEVDPTNPSVVYAATSLGLFRSTDAGRSFVNVALPTGECAGSTAYDRCQLANWVTDVAVEVPGGTTSAKGGRVLTVVGYRAGAQRYADGTPHAANNGLYRSETGAPGSFEELAGAYGSGTSDAGFAPQYRIGRTELGVASGPQQDHGVVYAIVQDAERFRGGLPVIDVPEDVERSNPLAFVPTAFNGIYVSKDFGGSWTRLADVAEITVPGPAPTGTESALAGLGTALLYSPGIQAWYDMYIEPDPTKQDANGVPTQVLFGLEELWRNQDTSKGLDGTGQGPTPTFKVVGPYFADETCGFFQTGLPYCPASNTDAGVTTTHPDHQGGIFLPDGSGAVTFLAGNDGGVHRQTLTADEFVTKEEWGRGANAGFHTLLPYDAEPAKDGTVWFGLQDNGSGKIEPDGKQVMTFGGDGFHVSVDPDNSDYAWSEVTFASMRSTVDGGTTWRDQPPPLGRSQFNNPFVMDPLDPDHLMTAGDVVVETVDGHDTCPSIAGLTDPTLCSWETVYELGAAENGQQNVMSAVDLVGDAAYVGFCGPCDLFQRQQIGFTRGLASNVGGDAEPKRQTSDGWHKPAANGLPNRYITSVTMDPANPRTVYVTLGGYANRQWLPPGSYLDENDAIEDGNVFKSTDAGETFVDISGSLPDLPAFSLELNQGQLVVGTQLGPFLSRDTAGSAWVPLPGVPAAVTTSVYTDPADADRLIIGTFARGVYEYRFSARGAIRPVLQPAPVQPAGRLPATGLPQTAALAGLLAVGGAVLLRRRRAGLNASASGAAPPARR